MTQKITTIKTKTLKQNTVELPLNFQLLWSQVKNLSVKFPAIQCSNSLVPKKALYVHFTAFTFTGHNYVSEWCIYVTAFPLLSQHQYEYNDSSVTEILLFDKNFPLWLSKANGKVKFKMWAGDVPIVCNCLVVIVDVNSDFVLSYMFTCEAHLGALL